MTLQKALSAVFLTFFVSACTVSELESTPELPSTDDTYEAPFIAGRATIQFDDNMTRLVEESLNSGDLSMTKAPALGNVLSDLGIKQLRRVFPDAGEFEPRTRREGLHRFYYVEFDEDMPVTKATTDLKSIPGVVSVTPQLPVRPRAIFNDTYFSRQWHYINGRYAGADINVEKVWKEFTVGRSDVIVSVVDEGVYMDHEDLAANLIPCLEDGSGSFNFNNNTPNVVPTQGHGTHVAGIVAAVSNNGIGVAGVAGGDAEAGISGVKVMSCQIFDLYGNEPDIYQAIKHGADHGAVILQCSWGFSPDLNGDGFTTDEEIELYRSFTINDLPEYKAALDYFIKYAGCDNDGNQLPESPMKGGVAIFAAGNDNFDYDPLVSYEPLIAVGSFGMTGQKSSFSNYGDWVDVAAPGGEIKYGIYSTLLNNSYGGADWIGTSMACPHVSGVAALLVSYFGGPGFTAEECRTRIVRGAVPNFFPGSAYIGRKLDAYGSFTYDMNTPKLAPEMAWDGETPTELPYNAVVDIPFTINDPNQLLVKVTISPVVNGCSILLPDDEHATYRLHIDANEVGAGSHDIRIRATNEDSLRASLTMSFTVLGNRAPQLTATELPDNYVFDEPSATLTLPVASWFSDPDGDVVTLSVYFEEGSDYVSAELSGGELLLTAIAPGRSQLVVTASDGSKASTSVKIPVAVKNPEIPVFVPSVTDRYLRVYIDAAEEATVTVDIYNTTGAKVHSESGTTDIFTPLILAIDKLAPGRYLARITYLGDIHDLPFVKI